MKEHPKPSVKIALSVFIVFHLYVVFVLPNPDGILYRASHAWISPYGNQFGFNTTWRFFSPNPAVKVLEYDVFTRDINGELQGETFRFPQNLEQEDSRENFNRKMNFSMYMMSRNELLEKVLGPRLCQMHPGAESVSISMRGHEQPTIESSKFQGSERKNIGQTKTHYLTDVSCIVEEGG
jgi:hypothetical protein